MCRIAFESRLSKMRPVISGSITARDVVASIVTAMLRAAASPQSRTRSARNGCNSRLTGYGSRRCVIARSSATRPSSRVFQGVGERLAAARIIACERILDRVADLVGDTGDDPPQPREALRGSDLGGKRLGLAAGGGKPLPRVVQRIDNAIQFPLSGPRDRQRGAASAQHQPRQPGRHAEQ